ncbi:unnamed protein product [Prunus armeniaca]|uniref:Uncharacterized protein n=1 Tax=Prunus armeniaca TaxID=36596 RepID=A0A6J5V2E4_PRUAR|nr:unnamed protein product [Prunus armeniaca]
MRICGAGWSSGPLRETRSQSLEKSYGKFVATRHPHLLLFHVKHSGGLTILYMANETATRMSSYGVSLISWDEEVGSGGEKDKRGRFNGGSKGMDRCIGGAVVKMGDFLEEEELLV